jgi:hypothetical protein
MSEKQFSKSHIKNSPCYAIFTLHTLLCSSTQVTHSFFFSPLDLRANKLFPHAIQPLCDIDIWHIPLNICSSHACNRLLSRTLISSKSDTFYFVSASSTWAPQFFRYSAPILLSAYHHARMYRKNILWEVFFSMKSEMVWVTSSKRAIQNECVVFYRFFMLQHFFSLIDIHLTFILD